MAANPNSTPQPNTLTTLSLFSYDALDTDTRVYVQDRTVEIRALARRTVEDIITIGGKLSEVKERLGHGRFGAWLEREFHWKERMAQNFMATYTRFKSANFADLDIGTSVLYMLAAPSVPDEAVETVLERARAGEHITVADVKRAINDARPAPELGMFDDNRPVLVEDYDTKRPVWVNEDGEIVGVDPYTEPGIYEPIIEDEAAEEALSKPANWSSASNEWYTPSEYIEAARELMEAIDLDPASNPLANETVQAARYYTEEDDGLAVAWYGRVWLNPPYGVTGGESNAGVWARKLIADYRAGNVTEAVFLVNANPERKWFSQLWDFPICFTNHRIQFYTPDGVGAQPVDGNALVYLGPNIERFVEVFSRFGEVAGSFTRGVARV